MQYHFHLLARAIILLDNHVLLAHEKGTNYTFLVGGHVENGEGIEATLKREVREELGEDCQVGRYLGAVEHIWENNKGKNYEVNHIFKVKLNALEDLTPPKSCETHIEFLWAKVDDLDKYNLQPDPLRKLIEELSNDDKSIWWASTLKNDIR